MNIVLIINESPWGSTLSSGALRLAGTFTGAGHNIEAVFFREDGVYNCLQGASADAGSLGLADAWATLSREHNTGLLVCSSSVARRLEAAPAQPFREAGLVELADLIADCDRVITF